MTHNTQPLRLTLHQGDQLSPHVNQTIINLCTRAFEEDFSSLMTTFQESSHVIGWLNEQVVSHALWVTRWLQVESGPLLRTAYVEAVATDPAYQNRGYATAVMRRLAAEIAANDVGFDLGALSPFSINWYARLGWKQWTGPLSIRTEQGLLRTPEEDGQVMILRLPRTPSLELTAGLSAEWRAGEVW